jgi:hypothetical protein
MAAFLTVSYDGWQSEQERRALSGCTIYKNTSSMHPDNVVHTGKTDCARFSAARRWF